MPYGPHTFNQGPWHLCMRCDFRCKIAAMTWQRGLLLCQVCYDRGDLLGQREQKISQVLQDGKVEFQIAEKLQDPVQEPEDMFMF